MDLFSTEMLTSGSDDVGAFADVSPAGSDLAYLLSRRAHLHSHHPWSMALSSLLRGRQHPFLFFFSSQSLGESARILVMALICVDSERCGPNPLLAIKMHQIPRYFHLTAKRQAPSHIPRYHGPFYRPLPFFR